MSKRIHAKMADALKIILRDGYLWDGCDSSPGTPYICCAITSIRQKNIISEHTELKILEWIQVQLGSSYTYTSWLRKKYNDYISLKDIEVQASRRAWVENMIKVLES